MGNILLFFVAVFLFVIVGAIGFVFQLSLIIARRKRFKSLQRYFLLIAVSIDQMANVVCSGLFNTTLKTKQGHPFGNEDETISSVLGKNKLKGTLTKTGKALDHLLGKIDTNHSIKSIEKDETPPG